MTVYADLLRYRELFGSLFRRDLRAKYKGSVLGLAWSLAHPVVLMLVYLLVFSVLLKIQTADYEHYWLFLLAGLPVWVFFATSLQSASRSLLENANLIRKVRFPRQLVPLSMVATQLVGFAVMTAIVVVLSLVYLPESRATVWLSLPIARADRRLRRRALARGRVAERDLPRRRAHRRGAAPALVLPDARALFARRDPGARRQPDWLVALVHWGNPVTPAIQAFRDPIFFGELPAAGDVIYLAVATVASLALGALVFTRVDDRVAVEV